MNRKPLTELHVWADNPKAVKEFDFERLKKLLQLGEFMPLLVMDDGTVLGGNQRLRAYQELGYKDAWISLIEFVEGVDGTWTSVVNGMPSSRIFKSKEQGMLEYALADNERIGYYLDDAIANLMPNYDIDWSQYSVDFESPKTVRQVVEGIAPGSIDDSTEDKPKEYGVVVKVSNEIEEQEAYEKLVSMGYNCERKN